MLTAADLVLVVRRGRVVLQVLKLPAFLAPLYVGVNLLDGRTVGAAVQQGVLFAVLATAASGLWFRRELALRSVTTGERKMTLTSVRGRVKVLDVSSGARVTKDRAAVSGVRIQTGDGQEARIPTAMRGLTPAQVYSALQEVLPPGNTLQ